MGHGIVSLRQFEALLFCRIVRWPGRGLKADRRMNAQVQAGPTKNEPLGRRNSMIPMKHALAGLGAVLAMTVATSAMAQKTVVGVSWSNFQEERWKTDEAAIKARLTELG